MQLFLEHPFDVQRDILLTLIQQNKKCLFGQEYQFKIIQNYTDFVQKIPLQNYESLAPYIVKMQTGKQSILTSDAVKWFAKSSGTSNAKSKFIPITKASLELGHYKAVKDLLAVYLHNNPNSKMFEGKGLRLGGSSESYKQQDTIVGDLSAIIIENLPIWADLRSTPKQEIALLSEWEEKMQRIIAESAEDNVTNIAGVPSWMLILLRKMLQQYGKSDLLALWPNLEVYFHGGVNFAPYKKQFEQLIPQKDFKYYEIYNASEGFFAFQDQNYKNDLLLLLDHGIFYEFIPMRYFNGLASKTIPLQDVELNTNYAIVITTNGGLWRYIVGDTIIFTALKPFRIKVTGRTQHFINTFGEELIIDNAEKALQEACEKYQAIVSEYTVAPVFMARKTKGKHQWLIAFDQYPKDLKTFAKTLDLALQALNSDYEAKRYKNITLDMLELITTSKSTFYNWLEQHKKIGGQHKIPRLQNNRVLIDELLTIHNKK